MLLKRRFVRSWGQLGMTSKWRKVSLFDCTSELGDGLHGTPKYNPDGEYAFINGNNLCNGRIIIKPETKHVDATQFEKHKKNLTDRTILVSINGTLGNVGVYNGEKVILGKSACYFNVLESFDKDFIKYIVMSPKFQTYLQNNATGTTIKNISLKQMRDYIFYVPDLETQQKISSILSAIDDKITLNTAINNNLEQQANSIFKSWFVNFETFDEERVESPIGSLIPKSLKMVQIADIPHDLETGKRPKGGAVSDGIPSVGAENVKKLGEFNPSSAKFIPFEFASKMKKGAIKGYELLLYKDGGKPGTFIPHFSMFGEGFPYTDFFINEHVFKLDFYNHGFNEFMYFYFQTDYPYHWLANNGGKAAVPGINQRDVNAIWCYDPTHPKIQEFCQWVEPVFTTILANCAQNMKLAQLRDTLLLKLMEGEIDISNKRGNSNNGI